MYVIFLQCTHFVKKTLRVSCTLLCESGDRVMVDQSSFSAYLHAVMLRHHCSEYAVEQNPMLIWNMDESGFHLKHSPQRIVGCKGANIPVRVSSIRENVTITACVSAVGQIMPPIIIVGLKGKAMVFNPVLI